MLIRLQTQSRFLENVAKENWSSPDTIEMTGRLFDFETLITNTWVTGFVYYAFTLACAYTNQHLKYSLCTYPSTMLASGIQWIIPQVHVFSQESETMIDKWDILYYNPSNIFPCTQLV